MAQGDLDISLLHRIMICLGEMRDRPLLFPATESDLVHLLEGASVEGMEALNYFQRHADYLKDIGLLKITQGNGIFRVLKLTPTGQVYVQPELAEFGHISMLPAVVKSIESQIIVSSVPEPKKEGMIHELRKAVADKAPDLIAKVVTEIGWKLLGG
jgi:hypothetical protein